MDGHGIRLPRTLPLGVGEEQKKSIEQKWDTVMEVEADIERKGLIDHKQPLETCPELSADILTGPDSKQYTETYALLNAWFNYTSELLAQVKARVLQYENMQSVLEAQTRQVAKNTSQAGGVKKPSEAELKERLLLNPEYLDVTHKLQRHQQAKILLEAKVDGIERSLRLISRQVEIRKLDMEQTRTVSNMPGRNFSGRGRFGDP